MRVLLPAILVTSTLVAQQPLTVVSAATYQANGRIAPGMIVSGFSPALSNDTTASTLTVVVTDSTRTPRAATVLGAGGGQVSFVVPTGVMIGTLMILVSRAGVEVAAGTARVDTVAPGLFTASATGEGAPAGVLLRIGADGARLTENLFAPDSKGRYLPRPFSLDDASESYLVLFGTGIRGTRGPASARLNGVAVPISGIAPQGDFAGLDQVNIGPLLRDLAAGPGEQPLTLTIDGTASNTVLITPNRPDLGQWGTRASLPLANSEMSVAPLNGKIYVLGGYPASRVTVADVQVYDVATDTWTIAAPLPAPVNHSMPAAAGGKLYVIGGQFDTGAGFVNTVYEYDPANNTWRTRAPMLEARGGGAAAVVDGRIYVAGSRPPRGADFAVYDPRADRWTTLPDLPTQRNHLAAVGFEGKVYVIGGRFEAGFQSTTTDVVDIFDTRTNQWSRGASLPRPRGGLNAVEARGCIHVFGGEGNTTAPSGVFPDHDVYDPVTDRWTRLESMPIPIHGVTGLAFEKGLIYLPGGGTLQGGSSGGRQHQVYRPDQTCR